MLRLFLGFIKAIYWVYLVFGGYKWYKLLNWVRSGQPRSDIGPIDPRPDLGPNGPIFPT